MAYVDAREGNSDFPPVQTGPGANPASCKRGTFSFPGVKCGRGVLLTPHLLLVLWSWKSRAILLPTLWATPGLKRENFTIVQCVPLATEPGISLIILPIMRILQRIFKRTTNTFLFISHTPDVLLFKFRCNIFIGVRIIKEMPGFVASGTHCVTFYICMSVCMYVCMYVCMSVSKRVLPCPKPRLHCFLSSHWPSRRFLSFMAFLIPSIQFFFGLPRALFCFGIHFNAILGNLPSAIPWTWPYPALHCTVHKTENSINIYFGLIQAFPAL